MIGYMVGYADGPLGGNEHSFYIIAEDFAHARVVAKAVIELKSVWDYVGWGNVDLEKVDFIPAGEVYF